MFDTPFPRIKWIPHGQKQRFTPETLKDKWRNILGDKWRKDNCPKNRVEFRTYTKTDFRGFLDTRVCHGSRLTTLPV